MFKIAGATLFLITFLPLSAIANCNLKCFRWECDIPTRAEPTRTGSSLVYCGNIPLYISHDQFMKLWRYQRANVNMVLKINGEYIDSPCIAAHR